MSFCCNIDSSKHAWWLRVRSAERQTWEVCDDLFLDHMEPHEPSRVLLSEPRPDRSCLSPLRLPYGRPSPRTPHTHMFSVLLSRSREMMRVAVPAVMACAADYRKSTVLCWSLIPSDGPVKAAGADRGSVCCSTWAFIPSKPSKSEVERETGARTNQCRSDKQSNMSKFWSHHRHKITSLLSSAGSPCLATGGLRITKRCRPRRQNNVFLSSSRRPKVIHNDCLYVVILRYSAAGKE